MHALRGADGVHEARPLDEVTDELGAETERLETARSQRPGTVLGEDGEPLLRLPRAGEPEAQDLERLQAAVVGREGVDSDLVRGEALGETGREARLGAELDPALERDRARGEPGLDVNATPESRVALGVERDLLVEALAHLRGRDVARLGDGLEGEERLRLLERRALGTPVELERREEEVARPALGEEVDLRVELAALRRVEALELGVVDLLDPHLVELALELGRVELERPVAEARGVVALRRDEALALLLGVHGVHVAEEAELAAHLGERPVHLERDLGDGPGAHGR